MMSQSSVNQVLVVTPMVFNGLRTIYDVTIFCKSSVRVTMVFNYI